MKSIKNNVNTKEIKVTGEHVMITFDKNKEIKLVNAQDLKGNDFIETDDGLYQIYEIKKEFNDNKYNLIINGGVVYVNII